MKIRVIGLIASIFLAFCLNACSPAKKSAAEGAASDWLKLVDAGNYAQSWDKGAGIFKNAVAREQWQKILEGNRAPLGPVASRKLTSAEYVRELPGAPDGEYYVIQYASTFADNRSVVETVTPTLDSDGQWRVAVYVIK
ncbi:MAG TPA: DUF4019 domain-containing protein [Candidatus Binatia bacterium]|nr:DUF4019 domain-containing protein [Candidatus Binatia bacterium]